MMLVAFVGCGQNAPAEQSATAAPAESVEATDAPTEAQTEAAPVVLNVVGSTSVGPVIEALKEKYIAANPHVTINVA